MKIKRRLYSLIPLVLLFVLLGMLDIKTLLLVPLALMALQWYFIGTLFLLATAVFLIYTKTGGLYGLTVMALTLLALEMGYLDRERAPRDHYLILIAAVAMSFPTYLLMSMLSPALPRFEVTALAALLLVVLYLFARFATS
ncbi:hypothetical protein E3E36_05150 [Thermococcus sp. M36]|uniref:hypothetical protein n=1 Tax=Thermococcus sp. M36 TaxID=1638261 RepID=UPI00143CB397|nr:hypothetical protein [Thermococcus sp. M36]NJE05538.1 hypothetical protein [Thermococcus sp. M36]